MVVLPPPPMPFPPEPNPLVPEVPAPLFKPALPAALAPGAVPPALFEVEPESAHPANAKRQPMARQRERFDRFMTYDSLLGRDQMASIFRRSICRSRTRVGEIIGTSAKFGAIRLPF